MRIDQIVPTFAYGDAIGNDVNALHHALTDLGYKSHIYAHSIVPPYTRQDASQYEKHPEWEKEDIILYHLSTGCYLNREIANLRCKKVIVYHNVTPPDFFKEDDADTYLLNTNAIEDVKFLHDKVDYCIADSDFNKRDLLNMGYSCPIEVLPIIIPFEDYKNKANKRILHKLKKEKCKHIIFVGRIAPNKKQDNIISAFYYYQKYYNPNSKLHLVGAYNPESRYARKLFQYVENNNIEGVEILGKVRFDELLAYYKEADIFVCMSEHEGFCVPIVEAMLFNVPIIAFDSTAVGDTLGCGGVLLPGKDPIETAGAINRVISDPELRSTIIKNQGIQLNRFEYDKVISRFEDILHDIIDMEVK